VLVDSENGGLEMSQHETEESWREHVVNKLRDRGLPDDIAQAKADLFLQWINQPSQAESLMAAEARPTAIQGDRTPSFIPASRRAAAGKRH
jgi:hypothetical protein